MPDPPEGHANDPLLEALFAYAPVGLGYCGADLRYRRVNPQLAAMNGLPVEAHIGRRPSELLPVLGARLETVYERVLSTGEAVRDLEIAGETPAAPGRTRHWRTHYFPVHDGGPTPIGVAALVVEVTGERLAARRADEALQHSAFVDAELGALYAALPVGVAFLDAELRYQRVNETLAAINGRAAGEHVGASLEDVLGPQAAARLRPLMERVLATREPLDVQVTAPPAPGADRERAFEASYFPVVDAAGALLGIGGVVRDVTDRHVLEIEQSRLLREALLSRAQAEAARVRADAAREDAEHARMEAERSRARVTFLARAGRQMAASMDWESTLRTVVRRAVPAIARRGSLTVVDPGGALRVVAAAPTDGTAPQAVAPEVEEVIRSGQYEVRPGHGPHAHLVLVPLHTPAGVIGALAMEVRAAGERVDDEDLDLVRSLAARMALHVHNSRLYQERSHIARTLQASLRPRALPAIPGAEVAARFLPAGDQNTVGGDFYDVFGGPDGAWTVIAGDVSGKGAEAAALTALARHTLRAAAMLGDDPAENLQLLNRAMFADSELHDFCTVFYGRLRHAAGGFDLRYSNGGHPPPLLMRAGGEVERLEEGRGPLVGALPAATFEQGRADLGPGDLLLVYTDGVTEVRPSDVAFGEQELEAVVSAHAGAPAETVVDAVARHAVELQSGPQRDDIALLAVRVLGALPPLR